ncbi:MAG: GNAT family N-acetyltransferase [Deinococcus sp.]|nr:GNAT family N-acetyltransferase [Deinococcus sp.]
MPQIETARLRLRMFTFGDLDDYHRQIFSDPAVMKYLPPGTSVPKEKTRSALGNILAHWEHYGFGLWAVAHKPLGQLIGHCGLQTLQNTGEVELAYGLAQALWGQGLATEAAKACVRFGFEELRLERIVAIAKAEHIASQRVMIKVGMKYEKNARFYNLDVVYYAISRSTYQPDGSLYVLRDDSLGRVTPQERGRA